MRLLGSLGDYEEKRGCTQTQYAACVSLVMQLGETDDSGDDEDDGGGDDEDDGDRDDEDDGGGDDEDDASILSIYLIIHDIYL